MSKSRIVRMVLAGGNLKLSGMEGTPAESMHTILTLASNGWARLRWGRPSHLALGIDICESDVWSHGICTNALRAFMNYYFARGYSELYIQTWSGNIRMIRCAEKLGFQECNRYVGIREVNG